VLLNGQQSEKFRREGKAWIKIAEADLKTTKAKQEAVKAYQEARRCFQRAGDRENECRVVFRQAELYREMQLFEKASTLYQEGVHIADDITDDTKHSEGLRMLGEIAELEGDYRQAMSSYVSAHAIALRSKDPAQIHASLHHAGSLVLKHNKLMESVTRLECEKLEKEWIENLRKTPGMSPNQLLLGRSGIRPEIFLEIFLVVAAVLTFVGSCGSTLVLFYLQGFHAWGFALDSKLMYWIGGATIGSLASITMIVYKAVLRVRQPGASLNTSEHKVRK
jgi:tetratricopeptide (TPR) repeat protein